MYIDKSKYLPNGYNDVPFAEVKSAGDGEAWKCVLLHRLYPEENASNHNIYIDLIDEFGVYYSADSAAGIHFQYSWEGMQENEKPPLGKFEKQQPEPLGNVPMYKGQRMSVMVYDGSALSDVVSGLHTNLPSDGDGNSPGHHSYWIVFQKGSAKKEEIVDDRTLDNFALTRLVNDLRQRVAELERGIR